MNECKPNPIGGLICGFGGIFVWWIACKFSNIYEDGFIIWDQIDFFFTFLFELLFYAIIVVPILLVIWFILECIIEDRLEKVFKALSEENRALASRLFSNEENYQKDKKYFEAKIEELLLRTKPEAPKQIETTETELNAQNFI